MKALGSDADAARPNAWTVKSPRPLVTAAVVWLILLATAPVAASTFASGEVSPLGGISSTRFSQTTPTGGPPAQLVVAEVPVAGEAEVAAVPSIR